MVYRNSLPAGSIEYIEFALQNAKDEMGDIGNADNEPSGHLGRAADKIFSELTAWQPPVEELDQNAFFGGDFAESLGRSEESYSNPNQQYSPSIAETASDHFWRTVLNTDRNTLLDAYDRGSINQHPFNPDWQNRGILSYEELRKLDNLIQDLKTPSPAQELEGFANFIIGQYQQNPSAFPKLQELEQRVAQDQYEQALREQMVLIVWNDLQDGNIPQSPESVLQQAKNIVDRSFDLGYADSQQQEGYSSDRNDYSNYQGMTYNSEPRAFSFGGNVNGLFGLGNGNNPGFDWSNHDNFNANSYQDTSMGAGGTWADPFAGLQSQTGNFDQANPNAMQISPQMSPLTASRQGGSMEEEVMGSVAGNMNSNGGMKSWDNVQTVGNNWLAGGRRGRVRAGDVRNSVNPNVMDTYNSFKNPDTNMQTEGRSRVYRRLAGMDDFVKPVTGKRSNPMIG
ncbi:hypothetical protein AA313_de0205139 [Arthrobotrys entomopaga]|nr:hypothetical protein AA313_de0205139 [Arthrobotrys entomopaga]